MGTVRDVALAISYYQAPAAWARQLAAIVGYPEDVRRRLHVVLVDDCSPAAPPVPEAAALSVASFRVYRTSVDVPWNQEFARNLGVSEAPADWVLALDVDHVAPEGTMRALMSDPYDPELVYFFGARTAFAPSRPPRPVPAAPGLWFLTRATYDAVGGLDERFAGEYFPSDRDFRSRVGARGRVLALELHVYHAAPGFGTPLPRLRDAATRARYAAIIAERGDSAPVRLASPWERMR